MIGSLEVDCEKALIMRTALLWLGRASLAAGLVFISANIVMYFMGLSASYNLGDPSKFEFFLLSFWHIGIALACIGMLLSLLARRF
jgi:predicted membrane channel-forming protein YqfA (hemolysin III family)